MICDKCGFEHNSRSVCPKCGARVVYVNEDYLRRKKEWEEAQKKGQQSGVLPGITHSTREDYDRKRGRDTVTDTERIGRHKEEGKHEDAGLPFDDIKEWAKKTRARLAAFISRRKKRRGADNPVIREINFNLEGETENADATELVKIRRRSPRRKRAVFAAAAAAVLLLASGAIVAFNLTRTPAKGRVFIYDGSGGYFADDAGERLMDGEKGLKIAAVSGNSFIACGDGALYVYRGGKQSSVDAVSPRVIAYNDGFDLIVYEAGGRTHIFSDGKDTVLEFEKNGDYTSACAVSDSGKYFVLTACAGGDDFTTGEYTVYMGDSDGELWEISRDRNDKEIIRLCDDGRLVFWDMATADYGIINGRALSVWEKNEGRSHTVIEGVYGMSYDEAHKKVYCLTGGGALYQWGIYEPNPSMLDDEVAALCANALYGSQGGIMYRKDDGFYLCENGKTPGRLFDASCASPEFYFDYSKNYLYYLDTGMLYYVCIGDGNMPQAICAPKNADSLLYYPAGGCLLALASDGVLWELSASPNQLASDVTCLSAIENDDGFAYCCGERLIYSRRGKKTVELADGVSSVNDIVFAGQKIYFRTGEGTVFCVFPNGGGSEDMGYAEKLIFVE